MAEVKRHGGVGLREPGRQSPQNFPGSNMILLVVGAKLVILGFELELGMFGPVVATTAKPKAVAGLAHGLGLVAFNAALFTR
jgi:hypothetical protein